MRRLKVILQLADTFIESASGIRNQFKGKSRDEAMSFLKGNLTALKSPETFVNLQKVLKNQSPKDLAVFLTKAHKSLSVEDAMELAKILTDDKIDQKMPEYLEKKIKNPTATKMPRIFPKKKK